MVISYLNSSACIKRKKTLAYARHHADVQPHGPHVKPRSSTRSSPKSCVALAPPMPRARARLGEIGARGTVAPGTWRAYTTLGASAQQLLNAGDSAERRPAPAAFGRGVQPALHSHTHIRKQSTQLTQGQKLRHCKLVNAYDLTIAPILKGKRNCPRAIWSQAWDHVGLARALSLPSEYLEGNPNDASYVLPLLDKVQALSNVSRQHQLGSTRSRGTLASMTRHCVRRSMREGFSPWHPPERQAQSPQSQC